MPHYALLYVNGGVVLVLVHAKGKPPTLTDLARRLGVSPMTVHRAVAGKPDVSAETRARVLAEIERSGWQPNMAARGLRQGKTFTLGILVPNTVVSFLPDILQGVNQTAESHGHHTFVCVHGHDPERATQHLRSLRAKGVDGIVHYPTETVGELGLLNELSRALPVVLVMRPVDGFEGTSVAVDDRAGGRIAADHLLELGHRRLGYVGYGRSPFSGDRRLGWESVLRAGGLSPEPEWVADDLPMGEGAVGAARAAARRLLTRVPRPTALFCASDRLAAGALQAACELGLSVPRDLSLVGFNNDPFGALLSVPLTTVAQPRLEIGIRAARFVLYEEESPGRPHRVLLSPSLVIRESCSSPCVPSGHSTYSPPTLIAHTLEEAS